MGACLIGALSTYATHTWNPQVEAAWGRVYATISQVMIEAAETDGRDAPPWWHAEVVTHDLRTPDVAVITLRPDQPYPFLAGQYASVETHWWPRVWRHYSFACAPRADGLLTFHVRAVPAATLCSGCDRPTPGYPSARSSTGRTAICTTPCGRAAPGGTTTPISPARPA